MRNTFINTLVELAQKDESIYLLTSDLGFSVLEGFIDKFPGRYANCGIAEQNLVGVAAGLALSGKKVYIYSLIPFIAMRCLEQLRNDICYQNLDVKIVCTGAGFSYGSLGFTHFAQEDLGILRTLPNLTVLSPADPLEMRELVLKTYGQKGPAFFRIYKGGDKNVYDSIPDIEIGKLSKVSEGKGGVIIGTGLGVDLGRGVAEELKKNGYDFKLLSMHTIKPIDRPNLLDSIGSVAAVFTIEDHSVAAGMGSAVAEILLENGFKGKFKMFGIPDRYVSDTGSFQYLRQKAGLTVDNIAKEILNKLQS
jgi:transketolase